MAEVTNDIYGFHLLKKKFHVIIAMEGGDVVLDSVELDYQELDSTSRERINSQDFETVEVGYAL